MWPVPAILGALLAQKKIAGKLEPSVASETEKKTPKPAPPCSAGQGKSQEFCLHEHLGGKARISSFPAQIRVVRKQHFIVHQVEDGNEILPSL